MTRGDECLMTKVHSNGEGISKKVYDARKDFKVIYRSEGNHCQERISMSNGMGRLTARDISMHYLSLIERLYITFVTNSLAER
jgi:hypothetical protein